MEYIHYGTQCIDDDDIAEVTSALRGAYLTGGPKTAEFEAALASATGARHAVAVSSCTAALHIAAIVAGVGPGDEVIVPAITFAATANCALYCGARPVFADVSPDTLLIDLESAAERVTKRTKAIMPVHYGGEICDMDAVGAFARARGLSVIQDCAHAIGGKERGRGLGSFAGQQAWSFHPVKTITTGEGGAVTTNDAEAAERLRRLRSHGITRDASLFCGSAGGFGQHDGPEPICAKEQAGGAEQAGDWYYEMLELGFNYRLSDIQCALGVSQLRKLPAFAARRAKIVARYDEAFRGSGLATQASPPWSDPVRHLYTVRLKDSHCRKRVFVKLREDGIGANVHYIPVYRLPYYERLGYPAGLCPVAEDAYTRMITLPLHPGLADWQVEHVIARVLEHAA